MNLLDLLILIIVISWIAGYSLSIGGGLIHLLLVIALITLIFRLLPRGKITKL